jgi:hypothetical protein
MIREDKLDIRKKERDKERNSLVMEILLRVEEGLVEKEG